MRKKVAKTLNISMRPQTFDDVVGLDMEVAAIQQVINSDRLPRAFLLAGPFGCGKTTLAYLIARAIQGEFLAPDEDPFVQEIWRERQALMRLPDDGD